MRVVVNLEKCEKSGECYYNHPSLFKVDDDGFPVVQVETLDSEDLKQEASEAAAVCPVVAIEVVEE